MPAADRACEDIQDNCQVDKLSRQTHIRDVSHPDLIWRNYLKVLHAIWIALKKMITIGSPTFCALIYTLQSQFAHQSANALAVDIPTFPVQLCSHTPISVNWPSFRNMQQRFIQLRIVFLFLSAIVVAAARHIQSLADQVNRVFLCQSHTDLSFLRRGAAKMLDAFFKTSISSACCPTRRSSSAIRACSLLFRSFPWKT